MEEGVYLFEPGVHNGTEALHTSQSDVPASCDAVDEDFLYERFYMAVIAGGSVATVSIVTNTFLFFLFVTNRQHRNSYNLYMLLLAFFDVFLSISYCALMAVRVLTNWTGSYALRKMWMSYMIPMLTISHIAQTASVYLIVFAAVERFCITLNTRAVQLLQRNRCLLATVAVMCGVFPKSTIPLEIQITYNETCFGHFNEFGLMPGKIVHAHLYEYWRLWFRNIFTIVFPFLVLFMLNLLLCGVEVRLRQAVATGANGAVMGDKQNVRQKKARIRAATRTLSIIVLTYLMSNLLSMVITVWEMFDPASLWTPTFMPFYILSVDAISILPIVACSLRLPIYASCQPLLRAEMIQFIAQSCVKKKMSRRATIIETQHMGQGLLAGREPAGDQV